MKFENWLIRSPVPVAVLVAILAVAGTQWEAPNARSGATGVVTIEELEPPAEFPLIGEMQVVG